jgi:hypothetical protein
MRNIAVWCVALMAGLGAGAYIGYDVGYERGVKSISDIDGFEDCKNAGYPIQESYPEVCRLPDGRSFTAPRTLNYLLIR